MTVAPKLLGAIAASYGLLAVALGAFAAHVAKAKLPAENLEWLETGARYQLIHAVAMLVLLALPATTGASRAAGISFAVGVAIFSGSLYALAFGAPRYFGAITPIGGVLLLAGWGLTLVAVYRSL